MGDFAERIKYLRVKKGLSQRTLSKLCGLSPSMINYYERRERVPTVETALRIAEYFGVSLDYLSGRV